MTDKITYLKLTDLLIDCDIHLLRNIIQLTDLIKNMNVMKSEHSMKLHHKIGLIVEKYTFEICISIEYKYDFEKDNLVFMHNDFFMILSD